MAMECICPILNRATTVDTLYAQEPWLLVRCRETGFVFLSNPPEYSRLVDEFAWEKTYQAEKKRRRQAEPWTMRLSDLSKSAKRILFPHRNPFFSIARSVLPKTNPLNLLDVGCGTGELLVNLHVRYLQMGVKMVPYGIELSRRLSATAGEAFSALGGEVLFAGAMDGIAELPADYFDGILLSSFLEHERQPLNLLRQMPRVLKPAGCIILKVPNYACWNRRLRGMKWCGFRFPDHVNYFTPQTLAILAAEAGLRVARQTISDRSPLSDSMYAVLCRSTASAS